LSAGPGTEALTWVRTFPGFNFEWGQSVMPGLMDPAMIYISNFGGGVWHGASNGAKITRTWPLHSAVWPSIVLV